MVGPLKQFENLTGDPIFLLYRLVGIGICAEGNRFWHIFRVCKLTLQQFSRIRLSKQFGFKIESWREPHKGVCWSRVAIAAAMFATAIGIDRLIKADVWRFVRCYDAARVLDLYIRLKSIECAETFPSIIEILPGERLETAGLIGLGTTPFRSVSSGNFL
ncbi:hypothetical protein MnTg02_00806 [bacterium MnTg02]|nr:hypothetical protein MnTg02_00806 [bacterium MnTg02]